jgi:TRAP-type C4-dicarboxylate transport system permease small subunit
MDPRQNMQHDAATAALPDDSRNLLREIAVFCILISCLFAKDTLIY